MAIEEWSRDSITSYAHDVFQFLEERTGRPVEVEDWALGTVLAYTLGQITIEIQLDWRDRYTPRVARISGR